MKGKLMRYLQTIIMIITLTLTTTSYALDWSAWRTMEKQSGVYLQKRTVDEPGYGFVGAEYRVKNKSEDDVCFSIWVEDGYGYRDGLEDGWVYVPPGKTKRLGGVRVRSDSEYQWSIGAEAEHHGDSC